MKTTLYLTIAVIVASSAVVSHAALIAWDSFATSSGVGDYPLGSIEYTNPTVGLAGFSGAWNGPTNRFVAANGGLTHGLTPGTPLDGRIIAFTDDVGWANRRLSRAIDYTPTGGTYYMSVLMQKDQEDQIDFLAGLAPLESTVANFSTLQGTYIGIQGGNISFLTTNYYYHLRDLDQPDEVLLVNVGETYFALMQFDYSTSGPDTVTATVYDGSSTERAKHTFTGLDLDGDIGRFGFITSDQAPTVAVDEWRFGTELSDVMVMQLAGDYNGDDVVDGADYTVWRDLLGQAVSMPNEIVTIGMVTQEDYTVWSDNFGATSGSGSGANSAVPEPSGLALIALGTVLLMSVGRNRQV